MKAEYKMRKVANLHIHTTCSDGTLCPELVLKKSQDAGLFAISFTDHDTIKAYENLKPNSDHLGVELISGVELSASHKNVDIHVLGYFIDTKSRILKEFLEYRQAFREDRIRKMVIALRMQRVKIDYEEVAQKAKNSCSIGRPHIAALLIEKGYVFSFKEAFERYIGGYCEAYYPSEKTSITESIRIIESANGISVLAHPGVGVSNGILEECIKLGIHGIEVIHPSHNISHVKKYQKLATENYMLMTGGSDFHGEKPNEEKNLSEYTIDYGWVEKMKLWIGI